MVAAGAANGDFGLGACLSQGFAAGATGGALKRFASAGDTLPSGGFSGAAPHHRDAGRVKAFVDFQHDVTAKDIKLATREGFR